MLVLIVHKKSTTRFLRFESVLLEDACIPRLGFRCVPASFQRDILFLASLITKPQGYFDAHLIRASLSSENSPHALSWRLAGVVTDSAHNSCLGRTLFCRDSPVALHGGRNRSIITSWVSSNRISVHCRATPPVFNNSEPIDLIRPQQPTRLNSQT